MKSTLLFCLLALSTHGFSQKLTVSNLVCDNAATPLGIEGQSPALGWQLFSDQRNVLQTAYRILVADDTALLAADKGNIWDSKKVTSEQSIQVHYRGKKLVSAKTYYWKVKVWDNKKNDAWSTMTSWKMGLMSPKDWKGAKWIGYANIPDSLIVIPAAHSKGPPKWAGVKDVLPLLRTNFTVTKEIRRATAFLCGLGHFEFSINGKKVGDHFLDPGWTQYDREAQYVTFDITATLKQGTNALGVMLGNGFYFVPGERYRKLSGAFGYPKMILRVYVEFNDGTTRDIISDEHWKTAPGPIIFSSIYGGEDYNATLEQKGWDTEHFNDGSWRKAVIVKGVPVLYNQSGTPVQVHEVFEPRKISHIKDNIYVADLGQNASGIPRISVQGKRGDTVKIIPAELLKEDGTANQKATGSPVYFQYILKGQGVETWQPRFSYYGFRYLQVEGCVRENDVNPGRRPVLLQVQGLHTRNSAERVGSFASSSDLFNRIFSLIDWSIKSNMASVLTDCPHREKLGWLEQTHLMGNSIRYNYDVSRFFNKILRDMRTAQGKGLLVPEYVPQYVKMSFMDGIFMDSPEWGSASIILPWYLYKWYGDKKILVENYSMMQRYIKHLQSRDTGHILAYGLSDWYDLGPDRPGLAQLTPMGITGTAIYYYDLQILRETALLIGRKKDAARYKKRAEKVRDAFNIKFFDKQQLQYGKGSQTANAMAVYMGLVPQEYRNEVVANLIKDIRNRNNSITAGDIGFRYLLQVLQTEGRSDVIYDMNNRTDVPGYGYQLEKGATALTESWQALPIVSNNHLMLGHLMEWFYSGLGGIREAQNSIACKRLEIDPQMVGNIRSAKVSYQSPYGNIQSSWKKSEDRFTLDVTIPANTSAVVYIPANDAASVQEGGRPVDPESGMKVTGTINGKIMIEMGSGSYHFSTVGKKL